MKFRRLGTVLLTFALLTGMLPMEAAAAAKKPVIYTALITVNYAGATSIYAKADKESKVLATYQPGHPIAIVDVLPNYLEIVYGSGTGFVLRHRTMDVVPVDPVNTSPYGVVLSRYFTTLNGEVLIKAEPNDNAETLITLQAGTKLAFMDINNGWARLIFKRRYGYVNTLSLPDLAMVAPDLASGTEDMPIAVYTSFYNIDTNELNLNRIINLQVCVQRMDRVMQPGESLNFNSSVGPFRASSGYKEANGLFEGELIPTYGGGSCQVSSTLYNVVLQLTGLTVIARAPHGANGAPYLPHGVDASSGDLNFIFRNDYDFPIRISSHVQDGALFIAIYRVPQV